MKPRAAAKPPTPAAVAAAAATRAFARAEHIHIASEDSGLAPAAAARTLRATFTLDDRVRGRGARLQLYAEGVLKVTSRRRARDGNMAFLDLRFLDPEPEVERVIAVRCLYATVSCGAVAAFAAFLLRFEALQAVAAAVLAVATLASAVSFGLALYRSHEKTVFCTLHGRANVLTLVASFGSMRKFRACVPELRRAIDEAAARNGDDAAAYLRAEMREHYRLHKDGILDHAECAAGTARILAQFDAQN